MPEIAPLRPDDPPRIGAFRLIGRLGENVYLGEGKPETRVVVRLLDPDLDTEFFFRVTEPLRGISGFCTARVVETGTLRDRPYLVSEYIEGDTLQEAVERGERLRGAALHRFAVGTMTALTAIHQAGVVHGDIRPGNVILGPDGPRVINVGMAQAMAADSSSATRRVDIPAFTAPERLTGAPVETPMDVFSWAATVVYAASGRSPFEAGSMTATMNRAARAPLRPRAVRLLREGDTSLRLLRPGRERGVPAGHRDRPAARLAGRHPGGAPPLGEVRELRDGPRRVPEPDDGREVPGGHGQTAAADDVSRLVPRQRSARAVDPERGPLAQRRLRRRRRADEEGDGRHDRIRPSRPGTPGAACHSARA